MLHHKRLSVSAAGSALGMLDITKENRLVPLMTEGLRSSDMEVEWWAINAVSEMKTIAAAARPILIKILKSEPNVDWDLVRVRKWNDIRARAACAC